MAQKLFPNAQDAGFFDFSEQKMFTRNIQMTQPRGKSVQTGHLGLYSPASSAQIHPQYPRFLFGGKTPGLK